MDDNKQLFIPDKIKVGFQKRDGTYTGKLAYVIYYDLKNVLLGVEGTPEFTWSSFTVQQWLDDIKARINKVQIATKKKALEHLETRLNAVISPELRAEMELEAISAELK